METDTDAVDLDGVAVDDAGYADDRHGRSRAGRRERRDNASSDYQAMETPSPGQWTVGFWVGKDASMCLRARVHDSTASWISSSMILVSSRRCLNVASSSVRLSDFGSRATALSAQISSSANRHRIGGRHGQVP